MRKVLPILTIGFAVSSLLVLLFGDSGVAAYRTLVEYRTQLEANVERLSTIHARLQNELAGLETDTGRTVVLARDIGLYRDGDRIIRVDGGPERRPFVDVGTLIRLTRREGRKSPALKAVGLGITLGCCLLLLVVGRVLRARARHDRRRP